MAAAASPMRKNTLVGKRHAEWNAGGALACHALGDGSRRTGLVRREHVEWVASLQFAVA